MNDRRDWTALIITVCAVITAMPRWIGALLASEGFAVPEDWRHWWIVASAVFSAAMAITEGAAFAYVFNAWRNQKDKSADRLLWFAGASGVTFVVVLAPFIASQVRSESLKQMLNADWALWIWSGAVAASTIVIVASVGYAQKKTSITPVTPVKQVAPVKQYEYMPAVTRWPNPGTWVTYFIQGDRPDMVKIGKTVDLNRRLSVFQTSCVRPIIVVGWLEGDRESELHTKFKPSRKSGEWFIITDDLKSFIEIEAQPILEIIEDTIEEETEEASIAVINTSIKACPGCGKEFTSPQGYSGHLRYCESYKQGLPANGNGKVTQ